MPRFGVKSEVIKTDLKNVDEADFFDIIINMSKQKLNLGDIYYVR